jgi:hypothetical protein
MSMVVLEWNGLFASSVVARAMAVRIVYCLLPALAKYGRRDVKSVLVSFHLAS